MKNVIMKIKNLLCDYVIAEFRKVEDILPVIESNHPEDDEDYMIYAEALKSINAPAYLLGSFSHVLDLRHDYDNLTSV